MCSIYAYISSKVFRFLNLPFIMRLVCW